MNLLHPPARLSDRIDPNYTLKGFKRNVHRALLRKDSPGETVAAGGFTKGYRWPPVEPLLRNIPRWRSTIERLVRRALLKASELPNGVHKLPGREGRSLVEATGMHFSHPGGTLTGDFRHKTLKFSNWDNEQS